MTFIYIIRCDKQNLFKIGISNNVDKRLKQLQTGNPYKLKCIYKIKSLEIKASFEASFTTGCQPSLMSTPTSSLKRGRENRNV